ncbi:PREDICTED: voltage-dependent calcium channel gamma-5 subunit [Pygoscelis adeliae]|nr:PREDICTED: voltage-dependent calcium channel gamma-5 subunit [Pygoscelis adeliae]
MPGGACYAPRFYKTSGFVLIHVSFFPPLPSRSYELQVHVCVTKLPPDPGTEQREAPWWCPESGSDLQHRCPHRCPHRVPHTPPNLRRGESNEEEASRELVGGLRSAAVDGSVLTAASPLPAAVPAAAASAPPAFAVCGLGLLGISVSTDYWLYLEEGIVQPQNQTVEIKVSLHSGLWRVCFLAGEERGRCFTIEYVMPMNIQLTSESTVNVLKMIRSATPFPLVSLFFMFIGFILSNIGHIRPHRTILAFVSGIFFILSGLSLVVGLVLYISSINDEMLNRTKDSETFFNYKYGWSFAFSAISFLLTESAGVMSVYLFMKRYTAEDIYRPHPGFYRPRLSNCSDYSGQFLHPDAWARGRSPSDISSEASLQMNSNYPALLKCPDYDQMSSSPC